VGRPSAPTPRNVLQTARHIDPKATPEEVIYWLRRLLAYDGRGNWDGWGGVVDVVRWEYPIPDQSTTSGPAQDTSPLTHELNQAKARQSGPFVSPEARAWLRELSGAEYNAGRMKVLDSVQVREGMTPKEYDREAERLMMLEFDAAKRSAVLPKKLRETA
jgi:hypothetical protein